ncbi:hypothetical protein BDY19DRAFT_902229 [Irpex rosettiformis]|uniref:Uncharacterized protein n=1 Tax=Irpex rosettiformis TaxID=378272 RepID=A0ACB8UM09_9APHY|nr:hypothetical protein BDY19DRAFT_902229 [Irpex rosettiformis]
MLLLNEGWSAVLLTSQWLFRLTYVMRSKVVGLIEYDGDFEALQLHYRIIPRSLVATCLALARPEVSSGCCPPTYTVEAILTLLDISDGHNAAFGSLLVHTVNMAVGNNLERQCSSMHRDIYSDSFDLESFFHLHDLNRNKVWERDEIEAVYGVHHIYSQKKSKDEVEHQKKADHIVDTVLSLMDKDGDGSISLEELKAVGLDGLPNFEDLGAEGHHYDIESEFFLHHEEQFHSTPETQTDESYNHPEDIEHFAHHESIERKEAEKEAKYQGISVEEALKQHEFVAVPPSPEGEPQEFEDNSFGGEHVPEDSAHSAAYTKPTRKADPKKEDPIERFKKAKASSLEQEDEAYGEGEAGYKAPRGIGDKLKKKNLPYKERMQYKFRRAWGDF